MQDLTHFANQFVRNENHEDQFNYDRSSSTYLLNQSRVKPKASSTTYVFFTIEFSNSSDTFYRYDHSIGGKDYFKKDPTVTSGGSNPYQGLSFTIEKLKFSLGFIK